MSRFTEAGGAAFSSDRMDWETPQDLLFRDGRGAGTVRAVPVHDRRAGR